MITLALARDLKAAHLPWTPQKNDLFAIPERGLDNDVFSITDMAIRLESLAGHPAITFQGAYEWALDYILLREVVWLPTETQLREEVERRLADETPPALRLSSWSGKYICEIRFRGEYLSFSGDDASVAYGHALLHLLQKES